MKILNEISKEKRSELYALAMLMLSVYLGPIYLDLGFALKPYMITMMILFVISIKNFKIYKIKKHELMIYVFYLYYAMTGIFSRYADKSIRLIIGIILNLILYNILKYFLYQVSLCSIKKTMSKIGLFYNIVALTLYVYGLIDLGFNFHGNGIRTYGVLLDRSIPRLVGFHSDPNLFGYINILFVFFFLNNLDNKKNKIGALLSTIVIFLTFSRGILLGFFLGLIVNMFYLEKNTRKSKSIIFPIIIFLVERTLYLTTNINLVELLIGRFSATMSDGGSGRSEIWRNGLSLFKQHPIFGIGIYNFLDYNIMVFGGRHYMHNTYLEILVESGLVGFILFLLLLISIYLKIKDSIKQNRDAVFLMPVFMATLVILTSLTLGVSEYLFIFFVIIVRFSIEDYPN